MADIDYEYQLTPKGNQLAKVVSEETKKTTQKIYQKFDRATINNFVSSKTKSGNKQSVENKTNNVRSSGTASQIKPLPQAGEFSDMLMKIYQFLQKSFETDKIRNQIENNFAEEKILEEKRRHEKLLESLKSLKEKNDMAFSVLQNQINSLVNRLNSSNGDGDGGVFDFDWRRRLKPGGTPNKPGGNTPNKGGPGGSPNKGGPSGSPNKGGGASRVPEKSPSKLSRLFPWLPGAAGAAGAAAGGASAGTGINAAKTVLKVPPVNPSNPSGLTNSGLDFLEKQKKSLNISQNNIQGPFPQEKKPDIKKPDIKKPEIKIQEIKYNIERHYNIKRIKLKHPCIFHLNFNLI
jgi:hypothetical protein